MTWHNMKTQIKITGQPNGNYTLKGAISGATEIKRLMFGGFLLLFETKKEARKALWEAYRYLKSKEPDYSNIHYSKYGTLNYDASNAAIEKEGA